MVAIAILAVLVLLHELGHLFAALWLRITVDEFGLGYPPRLKKLFTWRGVEFTLNWIPFGGFVKLHEESYSDETKSVSAKSQTAQTVIPFYERPVWQRLIVMIGGPLANVIVAVVAFIIVFSSVGIPEPLMDKAIVSEVTAGSPAEQAHLPAGHAIIALKTAGATESAQTVKTVAEIQTFVKTRRGQTLDLTVQGPCDQKGVCQPNTQVVSVYARTEQETPSNQGALGISFQNQVFRFYPWYEMPGRAVVMGVTETIEMTKLIFRELSKLVSGSVTGETALQTVSGPIGIVHQAEQAGLGQAGWVMILHFAGALSLQLAIMNLLPIPVFDGGQMVLALSELVFGRQRVQHLSGYLNYASLIFLIGLAVAISLKDIWMIWFR